MLIRDIMTVDPVFIDTDATLLRAAEIISLAEVTDIMVVDEIQNFVGVLSEGDILRAMLDRACGFLRPTRKTPCFSARKNCLRTS